MLFLLRIRAFDACLRLGRNGFIFVLFGLNSIGWAPSAFAETVALGSFEHADFERNDPETSAALATMIEAGIGGSSRWKFVERGEADRVFAELGLSQGGVTSAETRARVGKLLKADLLLSGAFYSARGDKSYILLECTELSRAEPLGQARVELGTILEKGHLTLPSAEDRRKIVAEAERLLEAASTQLAAQRDRTTLKLLFFDNKIKDASLKGLEGLVAAQLRHSAESSTSHRMLRMERLEISNQENELALLGLVEADGTACMQVADYYLWGSSQRINGEIMLTMTLWNGRDKPQEFVEPVLAQNAELAIEQMAKKVIAAAIPRGGKLLAETGMDQRNKVSALLAQGAKEIFAVPSSWEKRDEELAPVLAEKRRLLAAAIFFAPAEKQNWLELLRLRWNDRHASTLPALLIRVSDFEYRMEVASRFLISPDGKIDPWRLYGLNAFTDRTADPLYELNSDFGYFRETLKDIYAGRNVRALNERIVASYRMRVMQLAKRLEVSGPDQNDDFRELAKFILTSALENPFTEKERDTLIDALWPRLKVLVLVHRAWTPMSDRRLERKLRDFYLERNQLAQADALNVLSRSEFDQAVRMSAPAESDGFMLQQSIQSEQLLAIAKEHSPSGYFSTGKQNSVEDREKYLIARHELSSFREKYLVSLHEAYFACRDRAVAFLESHCDARSRVISEDDLLNGKVPPEVAGCYPSLDPKKGEKAT